MGQRRLGIDDDLVHSTRARGEAISHDIFMTPSHVLDNDWQGRGARRTVRIALYRLHEMVERAHTVVASSICPSAGAVLASPVGTALTSSNSVWPNKQRLPRAFSLPYVEPEGTVVTVRNPRSDAILQTTLQEKEELSSTLMCSGIISRVDTTHAQEEA